MTRRQTVVMTIGTVGVLGLSIVLPAVIPVDLPQTVILPLAVVFLGLAFLASVRPLFGRGTDVRQAEPESPIEWPVPGTSFDQELAEASKYHDREDSHARQRIHERLRSVAIDVLTAFGRQTRASSIEHLGAGDWTEDHVAAAFLRGENPDLHRSYRTRLFPWSSSSRLPTTVRRTVAALMHYTGRSIRTPSKSGFLDSLRSTLDGEQAEQWTRHGEQRDGGGRLDPEDRSLRTWDGVVAVVIGGLGTGLFLGDPAILLSSAIGVGYVVYDRVSATPPLDVTVDRSLDERIPDPGTTVRVTISVRNDGMTLLPDLRIVDGVPPALMVSGGSPRVATPLRPGETATFAYHVRMRRGIHEFGPIEVTVRDIAETAEHHTRVEPDTGKAEIVCRPRFASKESPLRRAVTQYVGQLPTDHGGDGLEFHSVREYRRGDAVARIDWKRLARTRELAAIAFREERAATVVCIVDARAAVYVAPHPRDESACDREIDALSQLFPAFLETGNRVGLAAFAPKPCWILPSAGRDIRTEVREAVTTNPAFPVSPPESPCYTLDWLDEFRRRIDAGQIVFLSPLVDQGAAVLARRLEIHGYSTTVVSVDPTVAASAGTQLAYLERQARIHDLREAGVRVIDWGWDDPLTFALESATRRWSQ